MKNKSTLGKFRMIFKNWKIIFTAILLFSSALFFAQITQTFNTPGNGSWTVPPYVTSVTVEAWGGGGGGGGSNMNGSRGSGGGSGGYSMQTFSVTPGGNIAYTIGSGGAGGSSGSNTATAGGTGGTTTILNLIANGGAGGIRNNGTVGQGGTATGGTNNTTGNPGIQGNANLNGGYGGNAPANGGLGGVGRTDNIGGTGGSPGGGGGGGERGGGSSRVGGSGGNGGIKITYAVPYLAQIISANTGSPTWCAGETRTVSVTIKNIGNLPWTDGGGNDFNIGIKWNTNGTSWNDYNVRVDAQNLAPGETKTYNFNITAQTNVGGVYGANLPTGNNNLTFDVVYELKFWFGNNNGGGGPGNSVFTTPAINILAVPAITTNPTNSSIAAGANTSFTVAASNSPSSYTWQVSTDAGVTWSTITNGGVYTNATTSTLNITGATYGMNGYRYRASATNACGTSSTSNHATLTVNICNGTTEAPNRLYINKVSFVGTMTDPPVNSVAGTGAGTNGYSNFTTLPQIAQQAQGEGVNVLAYASGDTLLRGRWKAWVDWNGNGIFETGELVYTTGNSVGQTANFGFAIPATQAPGVYRIRIRVNNGANCGFTNCTESYGYDFGPCDNFTGDLNFFSSSNFGETEDYLIRVVENCAAKITTITNGSECFVAEGKSVTLKATASKSVTGFRWYDSATGASFVTTAADGTGMGATFTTPLLSASTTYYVTAYDDNCESTFRTPVRAEIRPTPEISFTPSTADVCGVSSVVAVSASGSKETVHLVNENFESGNLGVFSNENSDTNNNTVDIKTRFQNRTSVYIPNGVAWLPAISSGFGSNKFALATSDVSPAPGAPVINSLTLTNVVNTNSFENLTLKLRMYYSRYLPDNNTAYDEYVTIDVSTDGGTTYSQQLIKYITNQGQAGKFITLSFDLSAFINEANLKFRILHYSWAGVGSLPDGVAVDDIELYGERPLQPSFVWNSSNPIGVYTDAAGTTAYTGGPISTVYFKPNDDQVVLYNNWEVTATAILANSCNAQGSISIVNNSKVWDSTGTWDIPAGWSPSAAVPTADHCVVIKKPVIIGASTDALAKNIRIETANGATGKLTINGSLTVTDGITNTGTAADLIVKSDANLLQINEDPNLNSGPISVRRLFNWSDDSRKEYNYLSSPVKDQNMKMIFGDLAGNVPFVTVLNETTNYFVNAKLTDYEKIAKGFAVKEPKVSYTGVSAAGIGADEAEYKGVPNNGTVNFPLEYSGSDFGFNLVGNPYPSNLDIVDLYNNSYNGNNTDPDIRAEFKFWDNSINKFYTQMGGGYAGWSYAIFNVKNGTDGLGTKAPGNPTGTTDPNNPNAPVGSKIPNRVIKVSQAFMVRALKSGAVLKFNNTQRKVTNTGTVFFGKDSPDNYYRLEFMTPDSLVIQNAVSYFAGGNAGIGIEDSKIPNATASDAIFNLVEDEKLIINGNPLFTSDHVVKLGTRNSKVGTYQIRAIDQSGLFATGQSIYLKDKQLGILTDISTEPYVFTNESGEFTNRFEIVYKPEIVLATGGSAAKATIQVYRDAQDFVVQSSVKKITSYELYDMSGRMIMSQKTNAKEIRFNAERLVDGAYVLKAQLEDGQQFMKKLRK